MAQLKQQQFRLVSQNSSLCGGYGKTQLSTNLSQRQDADNVFRKISLPTSDNFGVSRSRMTVALVTAAEKHVLTSDSFDFVGQLNIERRPGQFQYHWGRKVQPKDETI